MSEMKQEGRQYRVLLIGIREDSEQRRKSFCNRVSERYGIPLPLLRRIVDHCPFVLKKNLSPGNALALAKALQPFGAKVLVEVKRNRSPIILEFVKQDSGQIALDSSHLRKSLTGAWYLIGRAKNISSETLVDTWVLVECFDQFGELLAFEEVPTPINPLSPNESSPFKAVFEGDLLIEKVSITFKNSKGNPISAVDQRPGEQWLAVNFGEDEREEGLSVELREPLGDMRLMEISKEPTREELIPSEADSLTIEFESELPAVKETEEIRIEIETEDREETEETAITGGREQEAESSRLRSEEDAKEKIEGEDGRLQAESGKREAEVSLEKETGEEIEEKEFSGLTMERHEVLRESISPVGDLEHPGENLKSLSDMTERDEIQPKPERETASEDYFQEIPAALFPEEKPPEEEEAPLPEANQPTENPKGILEGVRFDATLSEEATRLVQTVSLPVPEEREETSGFSWMRDFRNAIEAYYAARRDIFFTWFQNRQKEGDFKDSLHGLLTILAHSRFDQTNEPIKAIENTERVFQLLNRSDLELGEISSLEGTRSFSAQEWKDLFHRALPKIHQIGERILDRKTWAAADLERLIQVIPHMSFHASRKALRWMIELLAEEVEIDFSDASVYVEESLYRVACRLGILNPHFDYYGSKNSTADLKIQSFAKNAFSRYPAKIEEPMARVGRNEEGGHCVSIQPRCEGCLFESFCPKLYLQFNPSEKGMAHVPD